MRFRAVDTEIRGAVATVRCQCLVSRYLIGFAGKIGAHKGHKSQKQGPILRSTAAYDYRRLRQDGCHRTQQSIWSLNRFFFNLRMIFWRKWPPNFKESFTSCNFFVWFWQKDLKLGGYDLNIYTNSSLAARQFFSDIWMVVAPRNSRTRDIRFSGLK